jgi:hypothetical protein
MPTEPELARLERREYESAEQLLAHIKKTTTRAINN